MAAFVEPKLLFLIELPAWEWPFSSIWRTTSSLLWVPNTFSSCCFDASPRIPCEPWLEKSTLKAIHMSRLSCWMVRRSKGETDSQPPLPKEWYYTKKPCWMIWSETWSSEISYVSTRKFVNAEVQLMSENVKIAHLLLSISCTRSPHSIRMSDIDPASSRSSLPPQGWQWWCIRRSIGYQVCKRSSAMPWPWWLMMNNTSGKTWGQLYEDALNVEKVSCELLGDELLTWYKNDSI